MSRCETIGSSMPSGNCERTREIASRTSAIARSIGVPIWNSIEVNAVPSEANEVTLRTPATAATAPSTFCMTCVSSSAGAAPGWDTYTSTAG